MVLVDLQHIGSQVYEYAFYYNGTLYHDICDIDFGYDKKSHHNRKYVQPIYNQLKPRFESLEFPWMPQNPTFVFKGAPKMEELKRKFNNGTFYTFPGKFSNSISCTWHRKRGQEYHCSKYNVNDMIQYYYNK